MREVATYDVMLLREKAKSLDDAQKRALALYIGKFAEHKVYVLYDTSKFTAKSPGASFLAIISVSGSGPHGMQYGASEIEASAALESYGPLLYDIVMALEGGLVPDRDNVSSSAKSVWKYYFNNRKDVKHLPLDDKYAKFTKTKVDDSTLYRSASGADVGDVTNFRMNGFPKLTQKNIDDRHKRLLKNPLNYAYVIKHAPQVGALVANHKAFMKKLSEKAPKFAKSVDALFDKAAESFFNKMNM